MVCFLCAVSALILGIKENGSNDVFAVLGSLA